MSGQKSGQNAAKGIPTAYLAEPNMKTVPDCQFTYLREDAGSGVICLYDDMLVELSGVHAQ